jgi:hypothetical protein
MFDPGSVTLNGLSLSSPLLDELGGIPSWIDVEQARRSGSAIQPFPRSEIQERKTSLRTVMMRMIMRMMMMTMMTIMLLVFEPFQS